MDRAIAAKLRALLDADVPVAVATVVAVERSASAEVGSCALFDTRGHNILGWVGGGCAEGTIRAAALDALAEGRPRLIEVDLDDPLLGQPCGGSMQVFVEPILPPPTLYVRGEDPAVRWLGLALGWRAAASPPDAPAALYLDRPGAAPGVQIDEGLAIGAQTGRERALAQVAALLAQLHGGSGRSLQAVRGLTPAALRSGWGPPALVIVGHSRICEALCGLGLWLGWEVTVDGPPEGEGYPGARRVAPSAGFETLPVSQETAVVIAAHHKGDQHAIMRAVQRGAPYVGLVASAHRSGLVRDLLADLGVADLSALRAPAGLDLGGRSPIEVAVSVLAEVVAAQRGGAAAAP